MTYWYLAVLSIGLAAMHYFTVTKRQGFWTVDALFVPFQLLMTFGTLLILDPTVQADATYAWVISVPLWVYIITSILLATSAKNPFSSVQRKVVPYRPTLAVMALLGLSALITVASYQAVGYNVFLLGIVNTFKGQTADYQSLRLESYATSRYLFPGYVNQFKNVILPALALVVVARLFRIKHPMRVPFSIPLVILALVGVLGTGQRGAFVLISLTVLAFMYHMDRGRFRKRALGVVALVVPLFLLSTFINGRSQQSLGASSGSFGKLGVLVGEMEKRILYDNQFSGQMAFRYTSSRPTTNGREWLNGVLGILPGNSGVTLPRDVFAYLYGTDRGTAPPSLWGSVHYDFGFAGLFILPMMLAFVFRYVTQKSLAKAQVNTLEVAGMAGFSVVCGNWLAGGPEYLLNAGAVAFLGLWWIGARQNRADAQGAAVASRHAPRPTRAQAPRPAGSGGARRAVSEPPGNHVEEGAH